MEELLADIRVVDLTTGIAGAYCTKLFTDAGAEVVKVEPPEGDPQRRWSATRADLGGDDGAFFRFLHGGKHSHVGDPADLIAGADLVVTNGEVPDGPPSLVVLTITPWGIEGPWAGRPATEFTVQAEAGAIGNRGLRGGEPFYAAGRITEWVSGTFAAVAALAAVHGARRHGHGERIDFSLQDVIAIAGGNYADLTYRLSAAAFGLTEPQGPAQTVEIPSIEPTLDGYVGFTTNSRQQYNDFCLLIGHPELMDDPELSSAGGRWARFDEWNEMVWAYTKAHTTAEVVAAATELRIPVAPVGNGDTVRSHEQLVARGVFQPDPTGTFVAPRRSYRIDHADPPAPRPAPGLGESSLPERRPVPATAPGARDLPLSGLRVIDLTAWWAGPVSASLLASLGAEVIHVESIGRLDGMRMTGGMVASKVDDWWEFGGHFQQSNVNKLGLTLDLTDPDGLDLLKRLIAVSDVVIENYTPRVLDNFGLDWEAIRQINERTILVRMPAFGLTGPWRDNTGFAQTMEQITGLAWLTGHPDDQPRIQRGPCDPLAGTHAAFALLVALRSREATGRGSHVEATMVEGALNAASEQLIEFTAYGNLMAREGNRSPYAAPQGLYPTADGEWLALSVETDEQWQALRDAAGLTIDPGGHWARRDAHDAIDAELAPWIAERGRDDLIDTLIAVGVPVGAVRDPRRQSLHPHQTARGFYETVTHPVAGENPLASMPWRYASVDRWIRTPAPVVGEHNRQILAGALGLDDAELARLEAASVIGTRPTGL